MAVPQSGQVGSLLDGGELPDTLGMAWLPRCLTGGSAIVSQPPAPGTGLLPVMYGTLGLLR